jgi:hypothetical protein
MSAESNLTLEQLRTLLHERDDLMRLEGKVDAAFDYSTRTGEQLAELRQQHATLAAKLDDISEGNGRVLVELGKLTERGAWGRAIAITRDLAALFGLGGMGLWALLQLLRSAP